MARCYCLKPSYNLIQKYKRLLSLQKVFVNKPRILEESGIHPANFAMARAIDGDKSDNLKGVYGVGLGKIAKKLPFFAEEESVTFDDLFDHCRNDNTGLKMFGSILECEDLIKENYRSFFFVSYFYKIWSFTQANQH